MGFFNRIPQVESPRKEEIQLPLVRTYDYDDPYGKGQDDMLDGFPFKANPFANYRCRIAWMRGWRDGFRLLFLKKEPLGRDT